MEIVQAEVSDLIEIMYLLRVYFDDLEYKGWLHRDQYDLSVRSGIETGNVYICRSPVMIYGLISFDSEGRPEYDDITWTIDSPKPLMVTRIVVQPHWQNKEIEGTLLDFAVQYGSANQYTSIRLDVFSENKETVALCQQHLFQKCGEIYLPKIEIPFYCFERKV
jgi:hypothetical protein